MTSISAISSAPTNPADLLRQQMQATAKTAMNAAAKALNLDPTTLQGQLQSGKSLKDVATAQGVDFSKVQSAITDAVKPQLDQAVSSGQLTTSQASDALNRLTSGTAPKRAHHHHHGGGGASGADTSAARVVDAAAQALQMDPTQVITQLKAGKSLQDLATSQGVDFSKVQSAMNTASNASAYSVSGSAASASGTGAVVNVAA